MKRILNILLAVAISLTTFSCFFDDDTEIGKIDVSEIKINADFAELSFLAMESVKFGVEINQTGEKRELHYEWSYRNINEEGGSSFGKKEIISTDSLLDYQFPYLGKYELRLMVDNGEDFEYKIFNLTVSSGYDEGLVVLTKDEMDNGYVAFLKTLNEQEIANGVENKVISNFYTDLPINGPQSIFSPKNKAIYISDADGRILVFNQQTMGLDMICRPTELNNSYITKFSAYIDNSSRDRLGCYCFTNDKKVYTFDSNVGELGTLTTYRYEIFDFKDIDADYLLKSNYKFPYFISYANSTITMTYDARGYLKDYSDKYDFLSVHYPENETTSYMYIVVKLKEDPSKYVVLKESKYLNRLTELKTYELSDDITVSQSTEFINSNAYDDFAYYIYDNKIYRWDFKYQQVPSKTEYLAFDIPEGEEIVKICFNGDNDGTKLFVCTYNSSRSGELKGSIYVYDTDTFERIKAYEGTTHKAVDLIYKKY